MFRSGTFVASHVTPTDDVQLQPNGVDLKLDAVFEPIDAGRIDSEGTEIGARQPLARSESVAGREIYHLSPGGYIVRYAEEIAIPDGHIGFLYPRSSMLRNACMLNTAVWDAGYEGRGEGLLQVHHDIELERGARIAQLVMARADHDGTYDGTYQGENLD